MSNYGNDSYGSGNRTRGGYGGNDDSYGVMTLVTLMEAPSAPTILTEETTTMIATAALGAQTTPMAETTTATAMAAQTNQAMTAMAALRRRAIPTETTMAAMEAPRSLATHTG